MKEKICESLFIDVHLNKNDTITIGTIYRSLTTKSNLKLDFLDTLPPLLKIIQTYKTQSIIMGNFNYNLLEFENPQTNTLVDLMYVNNFSP